MAEPSIKSSSNRGTQVILKKPEQSVQETTQRFVESLSKDIRISQHADLSFASKKIETDKWTLLTPLTAGRTGYLVFLPRQPVLWIDEQFKFAHKIPIRVSASVYEKKSIFIASLDKQDGFLRIEDCWMFCGDFMRNLPFSKRWEFVFDLFDTKFKPDPILQQGLQIQIASYKPLSDALSWSEIPHMVFAQGETSPRRLRIMFQKPSGTNESVDVKKYTVPTKPAVSSHTYVYSPPAPAKLVCIQKEKEKEKHSPIAQFVNTPPSSPVLSSTLLPSSFTTTPFVKSGIAKAIPHTEYPDTYTIILNDVNKGFAAVQELDLSKKLFSASKEKKELIVHVNWNDEFSMYEISDLLADETI
jgi:hypothetical protein